MQNLREAFKKKLKYKDRDYKWFLKNYLPTTKYSNFTTQINGFNEMTDKIKEAIEKYLNDNTST